MDVDSLTPEVDPEAQMQIRYKPEETPVTLAAKKTYLGRVYLSWAQYPITETEELENGAAIVAPNDPTGNAAPPMSSASAISAMTILDATRAPSLAQRCS